jgi:quinohemoprotein ethanol dehydrogenase
MCGHSITVGKDMSVRNFLRQSAILSGALLAGAALSGMVIAKDSSVEWPVHGGTDLEQRFSPLDQVNTDTVGKLGLAWSFEFDSNRGQEATPIVTGGVMYVSTAWSKVYALDAAPAGNSGA